MTLHKKLCKLAKLIQKKLKLYYNKKKSERPDFKKGNKVWLLYKNFKNQQLSKKLNHIKLKLFRISAKISNLIYKLDLSVKMKIYLVQHIAILKPAHRSVEPPVYKMETYRGQEEDKWDIQKVVNYKEVNNQLQYKIKWVGYKETTWEPKENLKNAIKKVKKYYKKASQTVKKKKN